MAIRARGDEVDPVRASLQEEGDLRHGGRGGEDSGRLLRYLERAAHRTYGDARDVRIREDAQFHRPGAHDAVGEVDLDDVRFIVWRQWRLVAIVEG